MGTEIGRCSLADGKMEESRTIPRTRAGGVGNAVSALVSALPIILPFCGTGESVAVEKRRPMSI